VTKRTVAAISTTKTVNCFFHNMIVMIMSNLPVGGDNNNDDMDIDDTGNVIENICPRECMGFHGMQPYLHKNDEQEDCSKLINCIKCGAQRYSKCSHKDCRSKIYAQCNPYLAGNSITHRLPIKTVYFRPTSCVLKFCH